MRFCLQKKFLKKGIVGVKRLGEKLAFWRRENGEVACIIDKCCHRGASISTGEIVKGHAQCPFHGFRYDHSGRVKLIPANGSSAEVPERYRVGSYRTHEMCGLIWIYWGKNSDDVSEPEFFEEFKRGFYYSQIADMWPCHYTRCIENQMDVVHLPFVHHNTIGKDKKTVVNGPRVRWEGQKLIWFVHNEKDDGKTLAKPASEMGKDEDLFSLQVIMPNIWQNIISDKVRIFAAFSPIDDVNTMIYLRFYQSFMPVWGLRHIIGFFGKVFSKIILRQDKRVVVTPASPQKLSWHGRKTDTRRQADIGVSQNAR